jgi:hypothetical protein
MGCEILEYPITIPVNNTIRVLTLDPSQLQNHEGVLLDVTGYPQWPLKESIHKETFEEFQKDTQRGILKMPLAYHCELSSLGNKTLERVRMSMFVRPAVSNDPSVGKLYSVPLDPLSANSRFDFYIVNGCLDHLTVSFPPRLYARTIGENIDRAIPLSFKKRQMSSRWLGFPDSAMTSGKTCDWKWQRYQTEQVSEQ